MFIDTNPGMTSDWSFLDWKEERTKIETAARQRGALFAEFDGENLTGYFLIGDFGVLDGGFHVFDGGAGFDLVVGVVRGGEDDLVVVVAVEGKGFTSLVDVERESCGVGAANGAESSFDGVLRSFGVAGRIFGLIFGTAHDFAVDSAEDHGFAGSHYGRISR